jgi:hypothetical protein
MADSLFEEPQDDAPQIDPNKKYLEDLVGEGKKFKDIESLAKGKWYADAQVEVQNKRMDQMRKDYLQLKADYDARAKLEEYLDQIQAKPQINTPQSEAPKQEVSNAPAINPDDIEQIVAKKFAESKAEDRASANLSSVMSKLKERYGSQYQNILKEKTEELGLTTEEVNAMARRSPELFYRSMGLNQPQQQQNFQAPPKSDTRFAPQGAPKKTWTYYQDMLKKDPKLYYNAKVTQEMVESMAELGDDFKDGDFRLYGD